MAKKKLLSEAQVRRFMGLAGMKPTVVSNYINEGDYGYKRDEEMEEAVVATANPLAEEEEDPVEDPLAAVDDLEGEEEVLDDELPPAEEVPGEDVEVAADDVQAALDALGALEKVVRPMADAAGLEGAPEGGEELGELPPVDDAELAADAPVDDLPPAADDEEEEELPPADVMQEEETQELEEGTEELEEEVEQALAEVDLKLSKEEVINEVAKRVAQRILRAKKAQDELNEALGNKKS